MKIDNSVCWLSTSEQVYVPAATRRCVGNGTAERFCDRDGGPSLQGGTALLTLTVCIMVLLMEVTFNA